MPRACKRPWGDTASSEETLWLPGDPPVLRNHTPGQLVQLINDTQKRHGILCGITTFYFEQQQQPYVGAIGNGMTACSQGWAGRALM